MATYQRLGCCGWKEITGLSSYRGDFDQVLVDLIRLGVISRNGPSCGAFLFTEALRRKADTGYASRFAADLKERKLERVFELQQFRNPNTRNQIRTFMWVPMVRRLNKYCKEKNLYARGEQCQSLFMRP